MGVWPDAAETISRRRRPGGPVGAQVLSRGSPGTRMPREIPIALTTAALQAPRPTRCCPVDRRRTHGTACDATAKLVCEPHDLLSRGLASFPFSRRRTVWQLRTTT